MSTYLVIWSHPSRVIPEMYATADEDDARERADAYCQQSTDYDDILTIRINSDKSVDTLELL